MSTDKTLADVQPGGRVRLATVPYDRARDLLGDAYNAGTHGIGYSQQAMELHDAIIPTQPSPGGQDALHEAARRVISDIDSGDYGGTISMATYDALVAALAARQPVGEPVALVVPGAPTRCRHCESTDLEWFAHVRAVNDVPHGRLTTHDVGCVFVLGCNECSETLHTVKADSIAALLAAPPAQAVDLPYSLDADPAGIRARVADVITGTLMVGAQGHTPPPAGHWAEPFWKAARADAKAQAVDLDELRRAVCVVNVVGQIDGHDVVYRNSVLDVIDTRRQRLTDSQAVSNG